MDWLKPKWDTYQMAMIFCVGIMAGALILNTMISVWPDTKPEIVASCPAPIIINIGGQP